MQKIKNKIMGLFGLFSNKKKETLDKGLEKTKESVFGKLARAVAGKSTVDDDVLNLRPRLTENAVERAGEHRRRIIGACYD